MKDYIPYGRQNISDFDIKKVVNVLKSDWITQGPTVELFEKKISIKVSSKYSIAVNSATSALHIACLSLGVSKNDLVWTSANTFVASANCALLCGAEVDFVDIDKQTWCMSETLLEEKLEHHKSKKLKMPKVVIPVHLSGQSCNMEKIYFLSKKYGFSIIEDASHAIGSTFKNEMVGSCKYSDITIFSFHPVKIITTGEGGVATTNNESVYNKLKILRSHGIVKDGKFLQKRDEGPWYYEQQELGLNYRITDIQAALGIGQLERLENFIKLREKISKLYSAKLNTDLLKVQLVPENVKSSRHLYPVRINKKTRNNLFIYLRENNIGVNLHYLPVHLHPFYRNIGFKVGDFPEAELYSKEAISLPIYPDLSTEDQLEIISKINNYLV